MNDDKCLNILRKIFDNVNFWLTFAETKNAANLVLIMAAFSICVDDVGNSVMSFMFSFLCIASGAISLISFAPITSKFFPFKYKSESDSDNLLFYVDIAKYDSVGYLKKIDKDFGLNIYFDEEKNEVVPRGYKEYTDEIIINSRIAYRKYKLFSFAVILDIIAFAILVIKMILLLI